MIIKLHADEHKITIPIPNGLVFNGLTAKILSKIENMPLTSEQLNILLRELRHAKRVLGDLPLVDIKSSTGENVLIKL